MWLTAEVAPGQRDRLHEIDPAHRQRISGRARTGRGAQVELQPVRSAVQGHGPAVEGVGEAEAVHGLDGEPGLLRGQALVARQPVDGQAHVHVEQGGTAGQRDALFGGGHGRVGEAAEELGGGDLHACTGSVLHSAAGDLVLTAAHCLGGGGPATFVPGFAGSAAPSDVWTLDVLYLDPRWVANKDPRADYVIARVSRADGAYTADPGRASALAGRLGDKGGAR